MIKFLTSWKTQLWFSIVLLISSVAIVSIGWLTHIRQNVDYVSALSEIALLAAAIGAVLAAVVYWELKTGSNLNNADREWLLESVSCKCHHND